MPTTEKTETKPQKTSVFNRLRGINLEEKHKEKRNLKYLPWATAWATVKSIYPDATHHIVKDEDGNRFHREGKFAYVETEVTIDGEKITESLAVMNNMNQSIPYEEITSMNVDKSIKRCLTKNLAMFGLDLNLWEGEELSDEAKELKQQQEEEEKKAKAELKKSVQEVVEYGNNLMKIGVTKEAMMEIIKKYNDGNGNPASIQSIEVCKTVKEELEKFVKKTIINKESK
jgi:hypothetical protein